MQRIEFLDCYDITDRKRGLLVSRKRREKKEEYNYRALVPSLEFSLRLADSCETNLKELMPKSKIDS